ncbi:hypothetical protein Y032_0425g1232 [Ancylostoma ceylanicum]|uniref:Serpentine receptor class gamma n=1 Tax=Ancylostoma ceylanicum TaxID=53326 RepID=A0A016X2N3_9BILA|nr:hypothetical protein Y032_0425g1232 [Ancylostoma ceylanicum]
MVHKPRKSNIVVFTNSFYLVQLANESTENSWWSVIYTNAPEIVIRISSCLGMHFAFVQIYMTFFISLNRMTFIIRSRMEESIWTVAAPICAAIACLSPFAATYPYLTNKTSWIFVPEMRCFFVNTEAGLIYISKYIGIDASVSQALIPYASDVMTLSTPYLITALNRNVRTRLFGLFNRCKMTSSLGSPAVGKRCSDARTMTVT